MERKLPICLCPTIRFECWTYQRVAIISAYREFDDWFIHHLNNLYVTSEYDCDFGWFGKKYNQVSHYEDILETQEKLYKAYDCESIIPEICRRIDSHTYTIIDIDSSKIYKHFETTFVAQFLIYGYDEEKRIFYTPCPLDGWHEYEIDWDDFIEAFKVRREFTKEQKGEMTARQNPYPILFITPKLQVKPQIQLSRFYNDLKSVLNAADTTYRFQNRENMDFYFYEGILGVLTGLKDLMQRVLDNQFDIGNLGYDHEFSSGYCKIYEYNSMFHQNLKRLDACFDLHISNELYSQVEEVLLLTHKLRKAVLVYMNDNKKGHLKNGLHYLDEIKLKEKEIFSNLVTFIENYFIEG